MRVDFGGFPQPSLATELFPKLSTTTSGEFRIGYVFAGAKPER
jgi:hypothetical protein